MTAADWNLIGFTVVAALAGTLLMLPFGLALAWWLARREWRGKVLVETLISLPLVLPPVATGLILLRVLGRRGPVGGFLHRHFDLDLVFTGRVVPFVLAVMAFPLFVRSARVAFEELDPRLEAIARTLGAGEWRVFRTISLPLAARGLAAGWLLAFARALGEFGATIMVAGNIPGRTTTLSLAIYDAVQLGDDGRAFRLLGVSVALALGAVGVSEWLGRRRHRSRSAP